jgi:hypothetical protein
MPASPFFSIIFFMMLLALGLGSQVSWRYMSIYNSFFFLQFASTDVVITVLMEIFPSYAKRRSIIVVITCIGFYIFSLPFTCPVSIFHYR